MDNGNDFTRESLVMALRETADGLVVDHPTLTRFVETLAKDLGRAEMLEKAEDIARGMKLAGIDKIILNRVAGTHHNGLFQARNGLQQIQLDIFGE